MMGGRRPGGEARSGRRRPPGARLTTTPRRHPHRPRRPLPDRRERAGQRPPAAARRAAAATPTAPEHDWTAAASTSIPLLRPAGTPRPRVAELDDATSPGGPERSPLLPLVDAGPAGLAIVYAPGRRLRRPRERRSPAGVGRRGGPLRETAMANLAAWSGDGALDRRAVRRAPPAVLGHGRGLGRRADPAPGRPRACSRPSSAAAAACSSACRTGTCSSPARCAAGDAEFAAHFADVRLEQSGRRRRADRRRVFELVGGQPGRVRRPRTPTA